MTQSISPETLTELSAESIAQYLTQHPDFFINHNELLLALKLHHESGKAISLIEYQLNRYRKRNNELQQQLNQLVEIARENDRLYEKTRRLVLELIEAQSLENLTAILEDTLRHDFKVDKVAFILFHDNTLITSRTCKLEEAQQKLGNLLSSDKITTGQLRENMLEFLFGQNHNIASSALAPLINNHLIGLLALGSYDISRYQRETGTLFLRQISDIICRIIPRFI